MERIIAVLLSLFILTGCTQTPTVVADPTPTPTSVTTVEPTEEPTSEPTAEPTSETYVIDYDTQCDDQACVALYLNTYHELPSNYMTKKEAREYGWTSGALHLVVEGMCIGGDSFGNYEGLLPEGQKYYECDIDTLNSKKRGAKRIIYSEGDDIWYTDDHYETFTLLYGDGE